MEYVHYGSNKFDMKKFREIENIPEFAKPKGGLWASRIDTEYSWKEWCENNEFGLDKLKESFKFKLKEDAKILTIENHVQLEKLPRNKNNKITREIFIALDFEKLAKEYDGIEVLISKDQELYWKLYGWDCDSILIMNPNIIV